MIPDSFYEPFMRHLFWNAKGYYNSRYKHGDMYVTTCDYSIFPTVHFLIENHWVEISPADYIVTANASGTECYVGFTKSPVDFFVLGEVFMRGFYTIHSDEDGLFGIVPHSNSDKQAPQFAAELPTSSIDATAFFGLTRMQIFELSVATILVLVCVYLWENSGSDTDNSDTKKETKVDSAAVEEETADLLVILGY